MEKIETLAQEYGDKSPQEILEFALNKFGKNAAISFSGAEDVVLIDMALKISKDFRVFSLDTGRLHTATYEFIEDVRNHYEISIELMSPEAAEVEALVKEKGLYSFYEDGHQECCGMRKVNPLRKTLGQFDAWITGQRADQSPATRHGVPVIENDTFFGTSKKPLTKFNPLSQWTSAQVWDYIRENEVPYNELHLAGFISIGCEPCTRAVLPNQHEREGRWWWEESMKKECGLHLSNIKKECF